MSWPATGVGVPRRAALHTRLQAAAAVAGLPVVEVSPLRTRCRWRRGPSPPVGTHRYVHMLFKQQGPISATDPTHGKRGRFNTRNFAKEHQLGDPVAVAWFNSHK